MPPGGPAGSASWLNLGRELNPRTGLRQGFGRTPPTLAAPLDSSVPGMNHSAARALPTPPHRSLPEQESRPMTPDSPSSPPSSALPASSGKINTTSVDLLTFLLLP
ncbi:predicted protein [Streptomyces viridosporus ATCC 14672]|uniref:Predicted protein n=1 Tax=Streptomyces viridosporus (strain ATCC 14672 / DSM 40746 / JCM 4963 / KCTC 9882 / NRRL B-12104 / FH 1290) TaxID=566461 RepID=D6A5Y0_STRV1|nr:predicted protein [Streptomyces viridosporus ATCC 14672]